MVDKSFTSDDIPSATDYTDSSFKLSNNEMPKVKPESIEKDNFFIPIPKRIPEIINHPNENTSSLLPSGLEEAISEMCTDDAKSSKMISKLEDSFEDVSIDEAIKKTSDNETSDTDILKTVASMSSDNLTQSEEDRLLASTDDGLKYNYTNETEYTSDEKMKIDDTIDLYISDDDMFIELPKQEDSEPRTILKTEKDSLNIIKDISDD